MQFYLLDLERTVLWGNAFYWKANKHGYTQDISQAGLFSGNEAHKIIVEDHDNRTVMIHKGVVEKIVADNPL